MTNPIGQHSHVIVSFISSRTLFDLLETDLVLDSTQEDFTKTGLRVSSTLRLHRLMTVTTALFLRELGELPSRMQDELENRIRKLFNLK